mmetsp:Transcript_19236/g.33183  ORF Transcript_19236/g.33183 Transcript_19236/m.33183 type:complete len:267 (+) Transcript_19236:80-880(+)
MSQTSSCLVESHPGNSHAPPSRHCTQLYFHDVTHCAFGVSCMELVSSQRCSSAVVSMHAGARPHPYGDCVESAKQCSAKINPVPLSQLTNSSSFVAHSSCIPPAVSPIPSPLLQLNFQPSQRSLWLAPRHVLPPPLPLLTLIIKAVFQSACNLRQVGQLQLRPAPCTIIAYLQCHEGFLATESPGGARLIHTLGERDHILGAPAECLLSGAGSCFLCRFCTKNMLQLALSLMVQAIPVAGFVLLMLASLFLAAHACFNLCIWIRDR